MRPDYKKNKKKLQIHQNSRDETQKRDYKDDENNYIGEKDINYKGDGKESSETQGHGRETK